MGIYLFFYKQRAVIESSWDNILNAVSSKFSFYFGYIEIVRLSCITGMHLSSAFK